MFEYIENKDAIEQSDFVAIAKELQKDKRYLEVAAKLEQQGRKRIILDRESDNEYLIRYYYLTLRPFARIVLHRFMRSDIDGLHDHPWAFENYILSGGYWETTLEGRFWRPPGYHGTATANYFHRVELDEEKANGEEVWTLFLMGPRQKEWGFLNENNEWVYYETYLENKQKRAVG